MRIGLTGGGTTADRIVGWPGWRGRPETRSAPAAFS